MCGMALPLKKLPQPHVRVERSLSRVQTKDWGKMPTQQLFHCFSRVGETSDICFSYDQIIVNFIYLRAENLYRPNAILHSVGQSRWPKIRETPTDIGLDMDSLWVSR
jgi:hypothetical protein